MSYLLADIEQATRLKKATAGGELRTDNSACPVCGQGKDCFSVQPDYNWPGSDKVGRWLCRKCTDGRWMDAPAYFMRRYVVKYPEAFKMATGEDAPPVDSGPRPITPPPTVDAPGVEWQAAAVAFVADCETFLWSDHAEAAGARAWLRRRSLTDDTIRAARLGYNPTPGDGRGPRGVTIPAFIDGQLWYVKTRRRDVDLVSNPKLDKYIHRAGCTAAALFNADAITYNRPAMLVESELCALAVAQVAGDLCAAVATGTTGGAHRVRWLSRVALASRVLVAMDADEPGDEAADWWLERLAERAERWTPTRKDPGDMLKEDGPAALRRWVADGLGVCVECGKPVDRYTPDGDPLCEYCYATRQALAEAA